MLGLFTGQRRQPIHGINGNIPAPKSRSKGMFPAPTQYAQAAPQQPSRFSLGRIGAALGSIGNDDGGAGLRAYDEEKNEQHQHALALHAHQKRAQQIGQQYGAQAQQLYLANPQAVTDALAKRQFGHHTVNAGNSVVTYGPNGSPQMHQAAQNFQHGNLVGTVGPQGSSTYNMGASYGDINTAINNANTHESAMRGHDVSEGNSKRTLQGKKVDASAPAQPELKDVRALQGDFNKVATEFQGAYDSFQTMNALAQDSTGASDVALGMAFFKSLDPRSTVREGEFAMAGQSMGLPDQIVAGFKRLQEGERFSPQLRQDLINAARHSVRQQYDSVLAAQERVNQLAKTYNIDSDLVTYDPTGGKGVPQPITPPPGFELERD